MRGPGYRGIIFISVTDNLDPNEAKREAERILDRSEWVDEFVVEWANSGGEVFHAWGKSQSGKVVKLDRRPLLTPRVSE